MPFPSDYLDRCQAVVNIFQDDRRYSNSSLHESVPSRRSSPSFRKEVYSVHCPQAPQVSLSILEQGVPICYDDGEAHVACERRGKLAK